MKQEVASNDAKDFIEAEALLRRELTGQGGDCTWYCKSFNPYPVVLTLNELEHQHRLQDCVYQALQGIVGHYLEDQRLQQALKLPSAALTMLLMVKNLPYNPGSYRLDFLHDTAGGIKICEINARFPTNAYFITHYLNKVVPALTFLRNGLKRFMTLDNVPSKFIERFKANSKVVILKEREHDWDIVFLRHELEKNGYTFERRTVAELTAATRIEGLVLELHQDELLRPDSAIVSQLCAMRPHLNDLRTILLAHDKRLLAILRDDEIMADYLKDEDREFLKDNIVETHLLRGAKNAKLEASQNKNDWVLKPNLLGKGEGIVFGYSTNEGSWRAALEDPTHRDYVLQRFVEQKKFPILMRQGDTVVTQKLNVVGTLLCFDDKFLGPGIYRASKDDIVNVAGGGAILFPMVEISDA